MNGTGGDGIGRSDGARDGDQELAPTMALFTGVVVKIRSWPKTGVHR